MALTNTRTEATGEVLRLIVDELLEAAARTRERTRTRGRQGLPGRPLPLTIETPDDIATQVLNGLFYDLPLQELQTFRQRVNAVTVDDVERVAYKYVRPDRLSIVLVGNAAAFVDQLKGAGFGKSTSSGCRNSTSPRPT